jgi:hypothetical protein
MAQTLKRRDRANERRLLAPRNPVMMGGQFPPIIAAAARAGRPQQPAASTSPPLPSSPSGAGKALANSTISELPGRLVEPCVTLERPQ